MRGEVEAAFIEAYMQIVRAIIPKPQEERMAKHTKRPEFRVELSDDEVKIVITSTDDGYHIDQRYIYLKPEGAERLAESMVAVASLARRYSEDEPIIGREDIFTLD